MQLQKLLREAGGDLNAGFVVKEGANMVTKTPGIAIFVKNVNKKIYASGEDRLPEILHFVKKNKRHVIETSSFAANFFGDLFNKLGKPFADKIGNIDVNFSVDEKCKGCHICERICPNENIVIERNKPIWQHKCGLCNACIQWCPQQAIHFKDEICRYRNPYITIEDLILRD